MSRSFPSRFVAITLGLAATTAVLTGCTADEGPYSDTPNIERALEAHDLQNLNAQELTEQLDTMPVSERPTDLLASVQPDSLMLTDGAQEQVELPLGEDEFYLAVAPYESQTHDCFFHSLTTCLGELQNESINLTITDKNTGETYVEKTVQTYDNGFFSVTLPADIEADMAIEHEGKSATSAISTGADDPTCVTTVRLA